MIQPLFHHFQFWKSKYSQILVNIDQDWQIFTNIDQGDKNDLHLFDHIPTSPAGQSALQGLHQPVSKTNHICNHLGFQLSN